MIDGLILELDRLNIGPHICDLHVPCVILADDTSLISNTQTTMQKQLNVVVDFASKWRLKYNPLKSCIIYFTSKRNRRKPATENIFLLGNKNSPIDITDENIYAGWQLLTNFHVQVPFRIHAVKGEK